MKKYLVGLTFRYIESNHETYCILDEEKYNEYKQFFCVDCKPLIESGEYFGEDGCERYSDYLNPGSIESESSGRGLGRKAARAFGEGNTCKELFEKDNENDPNAPSNTPSRYTHIS